MAVEVRVYLAIDAFCQYPGTVLAFEAMGCLALARQLLDLECRAFGDSVAARASTALRRPGGFAKSAPWRPKMRGFARPPTPKPACIVRLTRQPTMQRANTSMTNVR
jgi:hypothetical protein